MFLQLSITVIVFIGRGWKTILYRIRHQGIDAMYQPAGGLNNQGHTLAPRNLLCSVHMAHKAEFLPIFGHKVTLTIDLHKRLIMPK